MALVGGARREEVKRRKTSGGKGSLTRKETIPTPVFFDCECLSPDEENPTRYRLIAGLYSELVAVDMEGQLWRWAWQAAVPEPHPLVGDLGLEGEKVRLMAGHLLRISVVTETGKVRTTGIFYS